MRNKNGADEEKARVLTLKEDKLDTCVAYWCSKKGRDRDSRKAICRDLDYLGYRNEAVNFKSDQENSIEDLYDEIRELRIEGTTLFETSPKHESQSNGVAENAVKRHEGRCRLLKLAFERRLKVWLIVNHLIMAWLARHAAHMRTRFHVGKDGRIAHERRWSNIYSGQ